MTNRIKSTISAILISLAGGALTAVAERPIDDASFVDDRFDFASESLDATTAFIDIDGDVDDEAIFGSISLKTSSGVSVSEIIKYAKGYLGRPYRSGAKGPKAFDCSGFTSYVYRNFNIALSSSSRSQATQGERVSHSDIRPGDLLFFKGRSSKSKTVGHVGIAIDVDPSGNVKFIHAATSGGIRIDNTSDPYYSKRYLSARRVLD